MPTGVYKRTKYHNNISRKYAKISALARIGKKYSEETKRKIGIKSKGRIHSAESREKNRLAHLGKLIGEENPAKRPEVREKIRKSKLGKKRDIETIEKMRQGKLGQKWSKEQRIKQSGSNSHMWKGGISYEPYSVDWTQTLKRSIRERDKYRCRLCNEQQSDQVLSVHHINYNKKNCNPDNLISLCKNCHAKTNFNREYWINYFENL